MRGGWVWQLKGEGGGRPASGLQHEVSKGSRPGRIQAQVHSDVLPCPAPKAQPSLMMWGGEPLT